MSSKNQEDVRSASAKQEPGRSVRVRQARTRTFGPSSKNQDVRSVKQEPGRSVRQARTRSFGPSSKNQDVRSVKMQMRSVDDVRRLNKNCGQDIKQHSKSMQEYRVHSASFGARSLNRSTDSVRVRGNVVFSDQIG